MKINLDDPNLTAFALGELSGPERAAMEKAVSSSPEAQDFVAETQQISRLLQSEYAADQHLPPERSPNIIRMEEQRRLWSTQWGSLAAALAIFAVIGAFAVSVIRRERGTIAQEGLSLGNEELSIVEAIPEATVETESAAVPGEQNYLAMQAPPPPSSEMLGVDVLQKERDPIQRAGDQLGLGGSPQVQAGSGNARKSALALNRKKLASTGANFGELPLAAPSVGGGLEFRDSKTRSEVGQPEPPSRDRQDFNTATYDHVSENPFLQAATNPLSTFSIDVDTASYSNVRRFINSGSLPPKDAVRVEEMINYFSYDYREPEGDKPFSIDLDATACPWDLSPRRPIDVHDLQAPRPAD